MADEPNKMRAEIRARQAEDGKKAMAEYEASAAATRVKTEKLRALRLAKEAAEAAAPKPPEDQGQGQGRRQVHQDEKEGCPRASFRTGSTTRRTAAATPDAVPAFRICPSPRPVDHARAEQRPPDQHRLKRQPRPVVPPRVGNGRQHDVIDGVLDVGGPDAERIKRQHDAGDGAEPRGEQGVAPASSHRPVSRITSRGNGTQSGTIGRNASGRSTWPTPATT